VIYLKNVSLEPPLKKYLLLPDPEGLLIPILHGPKSNGGRCGGGKKSCFKIKELFLNTLRVLGIKL
jgi:hypothetical protein